MGLVLSISLFQGHVSAITKSSIRSVSEPLGLNDCTPFDTPSLTLLSPTGGQVFTSGQQLTITWKSCNLAPTDTGSISIISADNQYPFTLNSTVNDGQQTITIPSVPTTAPYTLYLKFSSTIVPVDVDAQAIITIEVPAQLDSTPRIAVWPGKVNQHTDTVGNWVTDPDGSSGAQLDKLTYCKKWYPTTASVQSYKTETITTWKRASGYEQSNYTNTVPTFKCVQGTINTQRSLIVTDPRNGQVYQTGQSITVNWTSTGYGPGSNLAIDLVIVQPDTTHTNTFLMSVSNLVNDGTETLTIPSTVPVGTNYGIHMSIYDPATTLWQDAFSNGKFTIQQTSSTCLIDSFTANPTTIAVGGSSTLAWSVTEGCESVVINHGQSTTNQLSTVGTISTNQIGGTVTPNTYILLASNTSGCFGAPYSTTNGQACNYINQSVTLQTQPPLVCSGITPSIKVLSPNGGESYLIDQQIPVQWSTCNIPSSEYFRIGLIQYDVSGATVANVAVHTVSTGNAMAQNSGSAIINDLPNTGGWGTYAPGNFYKISIQRCMNGGSSTGCSMMPVSDLSDGLFAIQNSTNICTINYFAGNPDIVVVGGMSGLRWSTTGCQNAMIANTGNAILSPNGFLDVGPIMQTTTYTLYAGTLSAGCNSFAGYSTSTGQSCANGAVTETATVTVGTGGRSTITTSPITVPSMSKTVFVRELKVGNSGADVTALQNRLKADGVYTGKISGYFGTLTQAAVKKYQTKYSIPPVGSVGPRTLQVLNK